MKHTLKQYMRLAYEAQTQKDVDKAIEYWTKAIEIAPKSWYFYFERASLYGRYRGSILEMSNNIEEINDDWRKAVADWTKVIELTKKPEEIRTALMERALLNISLGLYENAVDDLDYLRRQGYFEASDFSLLASLNSDQLERHKIAIEILSEGIIAFPNSLSLIMKRGKYFYHLGEYEKAKNDYALAITLAPYENDDYIRSLYKLGECYFNLQQYTEALNAFTQAQEQQLNYKGYVLPAPHINQMINLVKEKLGEN